MRFFQLASVKVSLCLILGILLAHLAKPSITLSASVFVVLLIVLRLLLPRQTRTGIPWLTVCSFATTVALGIVVYVLSQPKNYSTHFSFKTNAANTVYQLKIKEVIKPNDYARPYLAEVRKVENLQTTGSVLFSIPTDSISPVFKVDDELTIVGDITAINPPANPHQFDYAKYMASKGIYHQLRATQGDFITSKTKHTTLRGYASNFRSSLIDKLQQQGFGQKELGVIQALLLGQRNNIDEGTYEDYKNAGAVHILAVSGLHIGIFLLLLQFLLAPLERIKHGRQMKIILIIAILWAFAFVAGLSPSVVRAVTMFSFVAYAMQLNRPTNTFNIIALSLFFILLVSPQFLFQVGFQMSYAAVFAIVWGYPKLQRFYQPKNGFLRKGWQLLSVSCVAQLGVLPISLFYFHQFPSLFFISNLVIVPFLGIVLGLGVLVVFLTAIGQLPAILVTVYNTLISWMNAVVHWVAAQEGFVFQQVSFDGFQLALGYGCIIALVMFLQKIRFKSLALFLVGIIFFIGHSFYVRFQQHQTNRFIIAHQVKNNILMHHERDRLAVYQSPKASLDYLLEAYTIAERIDSVKTNTLSNAYFIGGQQLYIMDSTGIYPQPDAADFLLLTHSPKINFERLLDAVQPKHIIADGSNYKNLIARWKTTAALKKIPFHATSEKGAFVIDLKY